MNPLIRWVFQTGVRVWSQIASGNVDVVTASSFQKLSYRRTGNYRIFGAWKPVTQNDFGRIRAEIPKFKKKSSQVGKLIQYRPSQIIISNGIQYFLVFRIHDFGTMSTNNFFASHLPVLRHVVPSQTNTMRSYCWIVTSKMQKLVPFVGLSATRANASHFNLLLDSCDTLVNMEVRESFVCRKHW